MSYLKEVPPDAQATEILEGAQSKYGFVPNLLRVMGMRSDVLKAQSLLAQSILFKEGALPRREKEYIFLVCSAANLSTYCVTAHCEMVKMLGIEGPEPEEVAFNHTSANLPIAMKALLNFAKKLTEKPGKIQERDVKALRTYGYSDQQILETVLVVSFAKFANFAAFGLGTVPDFEPSQRIVERTAAL
jgi:uncharacterized peroxidase-related enzyme